MCTSLLAYLCPGTYLARASYLLICGSALCYGNSRPFPELTFWIAPEDMPRAEAATENKVFNRLSLEIDQDFQIRVYETQYMSSFKVSINPWAVVQQIDAACWWGLKQALQPIHGKPLLKKSCGRLEREILRGLQSFVRVMPPSAWHRRLRLFSDFCSLPLDHHLFCG